MRLALLPWKLRVAIVLSIGVLIVLVLSVILTLLDLLLGA